MLFLYFVRGGSYRFLSLVERFWNGYYGTSVVNLYRLDSVCLEMSVKDIPKKTTWRFQACFWWVDSRYGSIEFEEPSYYFDSKNVESLGNILSVSIFYRTNLSWILFCLLVAELLETENPVYVFFEQLRFNSYTLNIYRREREKGRVFTFTNKRVHTNDKLTLS